MLTLEEYELLMQAVKLKQVDKQHEIHMLAWLTFKAKAKKKVGKKYVAVYANFKQFFNYKKELKKALEKSKEETHSQFDGIGKLL